MDYKEKYEHALERAREQYNKRTPLYDIEYIFPELKKEREDEQMVERLKSCVYASDLTPEGREEIFAWLEEQGKKKSADEVLKIRQELYQSGYNDGYKHGYTHGQNNIAIALGKESIEALEHFVRSIGESGYASPYDNRTKLVYRLLEQLKQIVK